MRRASRQNEPSPSAPVTSRRATREFSESDAFTVRVFSSSTKRKLLSIVSGFFEFMTLLTADTKPLRVLLGTLNFMSS